MNRWTYVVAAALLCVSCGSRSGKSPKKVQGGEGQVCFNDGTCTAEFDCVNGICEQRNLPNNDSNVDTNVDPNVNPNVNPNNEPFCTNGVLEAGELCDGNDLNGQSCQERGYSGGELLCSSSCDFDESNCFVDTEPFCGNNFVEPGEVCDGADLSGESCQSRGFVGGELRCSADCTFFDNSGCSSDFCGNDFAEAGEACDGADLSGQTCASRGFTDGELQCNGTCSDFDTSGCTICGNGITEPGEFCDGADVGGESCQSLGLGSGQLGCNNTCSNYDTTGCSDGFTCGLQPPAADNPCDVNDASACLCEGCKDDGFCVDFLTQVPDDCVCPDCANDTECTNPGACTDDGLCNPYIEGCICADCVNHPECLAQ